METFFFKGFILRGGSTSSVSDHSIAGKARNGASTAMIWQNRLFVSKSSLPFLRVGNLVCVVQLSRASVAGRSMVADIMMNSWSQQSLWKGTFYKHSLPRGEMSACLGIRSLIAAMDTIAKACLLGPPSSIVSFPS